MTAGTLLLDALEVPDDLLRMTAAGAQLLFDMTGFSAVGIVEVLSAYPFYRRLFARMTAWATRWRPKVVVLVDYPGLNLRLAAALRKAGVSRAGFGETVVLQYVSPQLWAWKPKRRFAMARAWLLRELEGGR